MSFEKQNRYLDETLLEANRPIHEASVCLHYTPGTEVDGGTYVKKTEIAAQDRVGIPVAMDEDGWLVYPVSHSMVLGNSGSGKTTVLYKNWIDYISRLRPDVRPSFFVTDLKADLYPDFEAPLRDAGYKVIVFDMRHPFASVQYNVLLSIYDKYTEAMNIRDELQNNSNKRTFGGVSYHSVKAARDAANVRRLTLLDDVSQMISALCSIMVVNSDPKNQSWTEGSRACLAAILYTMLYDSRDPECGMTREKFTLQNLCRIAQDRSDDYANVAEWLERASQNTVVNTALQGVYRLKATVTRDGYTSGLMEECGKYASVSVAALTATSDEINFRKIAAGNDAYAIFVITDDRRVATNRICSMMINDLVETLTETADESPTHMLSRPFLMLLDEFANMPPLPNITNMISTLRSRRVYMSMAVQTLEQLCVRYGENEANILLDNCDVHIFTGANSQKTKAAFSESMGQHAVIRLSANIGADMEYSFTKTTENAPVVRLSDLDLLKLGTFYVRSRQYPNLLSSMIPYFLRNDVPRTTEARTAEQRFNGFDPDANLYDIHAVLAQDEKPNRSRF